MPSAGSSGFGSSSNHPLERVFLVSGITFYGLDQIRNQVRTTFELNLNLGKCLADVDIEPNQAVVHGHNKQGKENNDDYNNDKCFHTFNLLPL
jgi:hypothetical protein